MISVYYIDIFGIDNTLYKKMESIASLERRKQAKRYFKLDDQKRCICADFILKYCILQKEKKLINPVVKKNVFGKPYVTNIKDFYFNISHSGKWVVLAFSKSKIGIDIEEIQEEFQEYLEFLLPEQKKYVFSFPQEQQARQFTRLWTCLESFIKYNGKGFEIDLNSFKIDLENKLVKKTNCNENSAIKLYDNIFDQKYNIAICGGEGSISWNYISNEEIKKF